MKLAAGREGPGPITLIHKLLGQIAARKSHWPARWEIKEHIWIFPGPPADMGEENRKMGWFLSRAASSSWFLSWDLPPSRWTHAGRFVRVCASMITLGGSLRVSPPSAQGRSSAPQAPPQALSSSRPPRGTQIMHRLLQWPQGPHPPHWASVMLCTQDGGLSQEPEGQGVVKPGRDRGRGWGRDVPAPEAWLGGSRSTPALEPADGAWHGPPDGSVVSFCKQNFRDPNHMGYFLHLSVCVAMHEFPTPDKAATWRGVFAEGKSPGGWGKTSCTKVGVGVINKEPTS